MQQFGAAILVTMAIVIVLMIVLFGAIQFEQWRRKVEFQEKLGSSSSNLPTKAINRVLDAIKTARKNREKEWTADNKTYNKAWNKINSKALKTSLPLWLSIPFKYKPISSHISFILSSTSLKLSSSYTLLTFPELFAFEFGSDSLLNWLTLFYFSIPPPLGLGALNSSEKYEAACLNSSSVTIVNTRSWIRVAWLFVTFLSIL